VPVLASGRRFAFKAILYVGIRCVFDDFSACESGCEAFGAEAYLELSKPFMGTSGVLRPDLVGVF
jgi:hypothetical protein